ncbi:MAG: hypothetical protein U0792_13360 [Gemmataceae bacterium]
MTHRQFAVAFVMVALAVVVLGFARHDEHFSFLIGDCPYYALTTESLLRDGDFDLGNQLANGATGAAFNEKLRSHNGFFALSPDGRVVPKHSVLMPVLALPFRVVFGWYGFLIFNVVQVATLVYGISVLAGNTPTARLLALVAYVVSPLMYMTYNFSPDVLGTVLVVWAYIAATRERWLVCGLLAALAVWAKVYLAVIVLPAGLLVLHGGWRGVAKTIAAGIAGMVPMLLLNAALYGGPLITGYERDTRVSEDGTLTVLDHRGQFNQPFFVGLGRLLFDADLGAVPTAPLWVLWPVGAVVLWRAGQPRLAAALGVAVIVNLCVFACYDYWNATVGGNRFLLPAFALGYAAQGQLWERGRARMEAKPVATPTASGGG